MRPRIYVAGPISKGDIDANVKMGIDAGLRLLDLGYAPFIPHLSHLISPDALVGTPQYEKWIALDLTWIEVCDGLLRLPGESVGADRECAFAEAHGIPIFWDLPALQAHTFARGEERFHALLRQIGTLHDRKQADYGAPQDPFANVRAAGEWGIKPWVGCLMRLSDKVRRLHRFVARGSLANESAEDSMMDIAVYALIALILYREEKSQ